MNYSNNRSCLLPFLIFFKFTIETESYKEKIFTREEGIETTAGNLIYSNNFRVFVQFFNQAKCLILIQMNNGDIISEKIINLLSDNFLEDNKRLGTQQEDEDSKCGSNNRVLNEFELKDFLTSNITSYDKLNFEETVFIEIKLPLEDQKENIICNMKSLLDYLIPHFDQNTEFHHYFGNRFVSIPSILKEARKYLNNPVQVEWIKKQTLTKSSIDDNVKFAFSVKKDSDFFLQISILFLKLSLNDFEVDMVDDVLFLHKKLEEYCISFYDYSNDLEKDVYLYCTSTRAGKSFKFKVSSYHHFFITIKKLFAYFNPHIIKRDSSTHVNLSIKSKKKQLNDKEDFRSPKKVKNASFGGESLHCNSMPTESGNNGSLLVKLLSEDNSSELLTNDRLYCRKIPNEYILFKDDNRDECIKKVPSVDDDTKIFIDDTYALLMRDNELPSVDDDTKIFIDDTYDLLMRDNELLSIHTQNY